MYDDKIYINCQWDIPDFTENIRHIEIEIHRDGEQVQRERLHRENSNITCALPLVFNANYSIHITTITFCNKRKSIMAEIGKTGTIYAVKRDT